MRCACIDIGSNTTRLLVADVADGRLARGGRAARVHAHRAHDRRRRARSPRRRSTEVAAGRRRPAAPAAVAAGAEHVRVVATAAIRRAANRDALLAALRAQAGVEVAVLVGRGRGAARVPRRDAHARRAAAGHDRGRRRRRHVDRDRGRHARGRRELGALVPDRLERARRPLPRRPAVARRPGDDARRRRGRVRRPRRSRAPTPPSRSAAAPRRCRRSSARCSTPAALERALGALDRALRRRRSRGATGSRPSGPSCCPRAYWCSTRPPSAWAGR